LLVHFDVVLEVSKKRVGDACTSCYFAEPPVAFVFLERNVAGSNSPKNERLKRRARDEMRKAGVDSVEIVAFQVVINDAVPGDNDG